MFTKTNTNTNTNKNTNTNTAENSPSDSGHKCSQIQIQIQIQIHIQKQIQLQIQIQIQIQIQTHLQIVDTSVDRRVTPVPSVNLSHYGQPAEWNVRWSESVPKLLYSFDDKSMRRLVSIDTLTIQGWIKSRLLVLFRTDSFKTHIDSFKTHIDYRQFQKFLLVVDSFGPNRCGKYVLK